MQLPLKSPIGVAVLLALYGVPQGARAQQPADDAEADPITEIIVTASRREQATEEIPYSISVVNADHIANTGVRDIASLASQVPGVSMVDSPRSNGSVFPIIRGLNASPGAGSFRTFEQAPVTTYIGNSPVAGYFQFDDVQRIEVLRGPQGTLYGAGSLGGALRIIPNAPAIGEFEASIDGRVGAVAHSNEASYTAAAMINVPVGNSLAFRTSANYADLPGFVDVHGILRTGSEGIPVLADPSDPVNSSGEFIGQEDWNFQETLTARASLLWEPSAHFNAELAYLYSDLEGMGGRDINNGAFPGGPLPADSNVIFPAGEEYQVFRAIAEPYARTTDLASLDLSYDAGFATLSSTTSYSTTDGSMEQDASYGLYRLPQFIGYYAGVPINPRFTLPLVYSDEADTFTQEVRLVSNTGPERTFDYVVGLFYEKQTRKGLWEGTAPGSLERAIAQGCTGPYFFGASFPNCLTMQSPEGLFLEQRDKQEFEDRSVFGEVTWHFAEQWQATLGARYFEQRFEDTQTLILYSFGLATPEEPRTSPDSRTVGKVSLSHEFATNQHVYALWSQGFRRGGSNSVPLVGAFADNPDLLTYKPDSVDNYEIGIKGRLKNGVRYSLSVFDIYWDNPQVGGITPTTNFAVWNATEARSTGVEFDLNSPLGVPGLGILVSGAYVDARLTEDYAIPSTFGDIVGRNGEQLPYSPEVSAAATINYERALTGDYYLTASLNDTYRSEVNLSTFPILGTPPAQAEEMNILNASVSVSRGSWNVGLLATNLADEKVILGPGVLDPATNNLSYNDTINRPREVYLRIGYAFGAR